MALAVAAGCALGCSGAEGAPAVDAGGGGPDAYDRQTQLDMNVVVDEDDVHLTVREEQRPDCTCTVGEFPAPGECATGSDAVGCDCHPTPGRCIDAVRIERDGEVLTSEDGLEYGSLWMEVPDPATEPGTELVVSGCGGEARIDLTSEASPVPEIISASLTGATVEAAWETTGDSSSQLVSLSNGFSSRECHADYGGSFVEDHPSFQYATRMRVRTVVSTTHETPLGRARVWTGSDDLHRFDTSSR